MQPRPNSCVGCPAFEKGRGFVPGHGPRDARLAIIGQGPGRQEVEGLAVDGGRVYRPFVGASGAKLDRWFEVVNQRRVQQGKAPVRRSDVYLDNVVRCHLTNGRKDRAPTAREVAFCTRAHLLPNLLAMPNLRVVLGLGTPAMRWLFGPRANELFAGHVEWVDLANKLEGAP